jgi:general L-amino acid transport system permease protein
MTTTEMQPPRTVVGPLAWLRQNLFSTWYNALLTLLGVWILVSFIPPVLEWNATEARWGVINANITLFMVGLYPRDQVWRIWIVVFLLAAQVGLSWGVWKKAARDFALIGLGAALAFCVISLIIGYPAWVNWAISAALLGAFYFIGTKIPRGGLVGGIGWLLYFPVILFFVAGSSAIPSMPPVEPGLWGGLLLTVLLAVVGIVGSLPFGILLALGRRSNLPIVRTFSILYIELVRGMPLVTILYMADILLPLFLPADVRPDRVLRAMVGFILFEAAYQAENVRGGLQSISRGQYEAANALGLNNMLTMLLVILPQALRAVVPALFNSFISLFKDTSLVAIIGLFDLLRTGRSVLAQPEWLGTHVEIFMFAFLIYWGFNLAFSHGSRRVEEALGLGKR